MNPPVKTFKSSLRIFSRQFHKWLALIVGIQVLAWVLGGAIFALFPFNAWVKSGDVMHKSVKPSEQPALQIGVLPLADVAARHVPLLSLELIGQGKAIYYRATRPNGTKFLIDPRSGNALAPIDEAVVRRLAGEMYSGSAVLREVKRIDKAEKTLGIVDEMHGSARLLRRLLDVLHCDANMSGQGLKITHIVGQRAFRARLERGRVDQPLACQCPDVLTILRAESGHFRDREIKRGQYMQRQTSRVNALD